MKETLTVPKCWMPACCGLLTGRNWVVVRPAGAGDWLLLCWGEDPKEPQKTHTNPAVGLRHCPWCGETLKDGDSVPVSALPHPAAHHLTMTSQPPDSVPDSIANLQFFKPEES